LVLKDGKVPVARRENVAIRVRKACRGMLGRRAGRVWKVKGFKVTRVLLGFRALRVMPGRRVLKGSPESVCKDRKVFRV
jgi:hypothetical protein